MPPHTLHQDNPVSCCSVGSRNYRDGKSLSNIETTTNGYVNLKAFTKLGGI